MTTPTLRVVGGGEPNDEELAALVAVVALVQARAESEGPGPVANRWQRSARPAPAHGGEGWLAVARRSSLRGGR